MAAPVGLPHQFPDWRGSPGEHPCMKKADKTANAEKTAYYAGIRIFSQALGGADNPYPRYSGRATAWEQGFLDAQKAASTNDHTVSAETLHEQLSEWSDSVA